MWRGLGTLHWRLQRQRRLQFNKRWLWGAPCLTRTWLLSTASVMFGTRPPSNAANIYMQPPSSNNAAYDAYYSSDDPVERRLLLQYTVSTHHGIRAKAVLRKNVTDAPSNS